MKTESHVYTVLVAVSFLMGFGAKAGQAESAGSPTLLPATPISEEGSSAPPPAPMQVTGEERVSLGTLVGELLESNPEILAFERRVEAARSRPSRVSSLPNLTVSLINRNVTRPIPFADLGDEPMSTGGVGFTQALPFPGKLRLRGKIAEKEADASMSAYRSRVLDLTSELKQAYFRLHFVHQAIDILRSQQGFLDQLTKIAETRYAVGKGIQQDVLRAQVEQSLLENRLILLERERESLEARINHLVNRTPQARLARPADYAKPELTHSLDELYRMALRRAPNLRQRQALTDRNALTLNLARKDYYPDFSVTTAYLNRGRFTSLWETRFNVEVPIYFWRKQRYGVREAASRLAEARHAYTGAEQELLFRVKDEYLAAKASDRLVSLYAKAIVPQASLALESSLSGYEVGNVDFLTLMNNFVTILDYETNYWDQYAGLAQSMARLEALVATNLIK